MEIPPPDLPGVPAFGGPKRMLDPPLRQELRKLLIGWKQAVRGSTSDPQKVELFIHFLRVGNKGLE